MSMDLQNYAESTNNNPKEKRKEKKAHASYKRLHNCFKKRVRVFYEGGRLIPNHLNNLAQYVV